MPAFSSMRTPGTPTRRGRCSSSTTAPSATRFDRHEHGSIGTTVTVLPPHVVHDGRAATSRGFAKRVVYLDPEVVGEHLIGRAVDRPTIGDPALIRSVRALHGALRRPADALEADAGGVRGRAARGPPDG